MDVGPTEFIVELRTPKKLEGWGPDPHHAARPSLRRSDACHDGSSNLGRTGFKRLRCHRRFLSAGR